jgi:6-phosphogluconolactonase
MLLASLVLLAGSMAPSAALAQPQQKAKEAQATASDDSKVDAFWVYVGTYTGGKSPSEGIYLFELELADGRLIPRGVAGRSKDPSFLAIHPSGRFLYSVNELGELNGRPGGGVTSYAIDRLTGGLTTLNQQASAGAGPCHLTVDRTGKVVLVANYGSGSVAALPIQENGSLKPASSAIQHEGQGTDPSRQEGPHAHSINVDTANRFAIAADLGLDRVFVYKLDAEHGSLAANDPPAVSIAPGSGPRHFAFHPGGRFAYVINELANTITAFSYDADKGVLTQNQTITTLPAEYSGRSYTAEVQVHPSGKFVYGSNRGHDSIAVFSVDESSGKLSLVEIEPTQGKNPRNFAIDPTGSYLLAENQDSDSIVVFKIDTDSGKLEPTGTKVIVPMPVCIKMMPVHGVSGK